MDAAAPPRRRLGLWVVAALLALVYAPTVMWLVHRWSLGIWYHVHGFAVLPIAGWLAWSQLKKMEGEARDPTLWGLAFLIPAAALHVLDAALKFQILSAISLVVLLPGLSLLLLGARRTGRLWFPLLFLGFAIPIPLVVASKIHLVLRQIASVLTEAALSGIGYDVERDGTMLQVGPESLQIADACSGFSTLMALTMAGLLLAYFGRARAWRAGTLVALIFPIAVVANTFRCILLCMLVVAFGRDVLATFVHDLSGFLAFALALGLLLTVERWLLGKPKKEEPETC